MAFDIYSTGRLLMAVEGINPASSFLRDRYFPTNAGDIFNTEQVLAEYKDGDRRLAPFVTPYQNGFPVTRRSAEMHAYTPATIAPKLPLTVDVLSKRGFGEALFGEMSPQQRAQVYAMDDLAALDAMVTRREELMAASVMLDNACKVESFGDSKEEAIEDEVRYYSEASNPASVSVTTKWDATGADILGDLADMVFELTSNGLEASEFVCSPDVADAIVNDETVQKMLDNRRYELGEVAPEITAPGAAVMCVLNVRGRNISVISYDEMYENASGVLTPYIPSGCGVMTAPGAGRTVYGAVTQLEQADGEFHTYAKNRVPKYVANADGNIRTLTLAARPLMVPNNKNTFVSAKQLLTA